MSTPDGLPPGATPSLPAEHRLGAGHVPSKETTSVNAPTPGAALAGARVPGAPTLPDWDPATMSVVMSRMANDLFGAPPTSVSPESAAPMTQQPNAPAVQGGAPAPVAPTELPQNVPSQTAVASSVTPSMLPTSTEPDTFTRVNPFLAPLNFNSLPTHSLPDFTLPLLDGGPTSEQLDSQGMLPSSAPEAVVPASTMPTAVDAFEIQPATVPNIRLMAGAPFDANAIRREFPILNERVHGKRLVWLDNAATTQKPRAVIERLKTFYERENSNIHRAAHTLAARATDAYENARDTVRKFLNARTKNEIIFVRGATEGINLVAQTWGRRNINAGDEIVITHLEHHANIVPWQLLVAEKGAKLRVAPIDDRGQIILDEFDKLLGPKTKLVSMTQVSNALGSITPAKQMIEMAHRHGAKVLLDGAQSVSHMPVDLQALDAEFFVFSGHKIFAPTGIGVVFGKSEIVEQMPPWQGGGNMIQDVTFERTLYQPPPMRFEAGTGNIADAVGLGAALDWLSRIGVENVGRYEHELLEYGTERLREVPGLKMIGTAMEKAGVLSFVLEGQKTEEVGGLLDQEGIAVRSGHHCAQPALRRMGVEASVRASLAPYNTCEDLDALVDALKKLQTGRARVR